MKVLLAIPSKNRAEILSKYTLKWLLALPLELEWRVFVEPQDYEQYTKIVDPARLVQIADNDRGLSFSKGIIKLYAQEHGYDFVFKLDDDVRGFTDFRKTCTPQETADLLVRVLGELEVYFKEYPKLGAVSFPYRNEMFLDGLAQKKVKRLQTCYLVRTHLLYSNPRLKVFEDFANGLYVLTNGYSIVQWYRVGIDLGVEVGKGTGGLQSFDRVALAQESFDVLREIYPPLLFKRVEKPWKIEPDLRSVKL